MDIYLELSMTSQLVLQFFNDFYVGFIGNECSCTCALGYYVQAIFLVIALWNMLSYDLTSSSTVLY